MRQAHLGGGGGAGRFGQRGVLQLTHLVLGHQVVAGLVVPGPGKTAGDKGRAGLLDIAVFRTVLTDVDRVVIQGTCDRNEHFAKHHRTFAGHRQHDVASLGHRVVILLFPARRRGVEQVAEAQG
ncbi:hypothetical protein D9M73_289070 [compost metagenome]